MNALVARFLGYWTPTVTLQDKPLAEPEPCYGQSRPVTGFYEGLTEEQKKRALEYTGEEDHGEPELRRRARAR